MPVIECPKCGAKNQLNPWDDPNALRCGKCKRGLGRDPVVVASTQGRKDSTVIMEPARFKDEKYQPPVKAKPKKKVFFAIVALLLILIVFGVQKYHLIDNNIEQRYPFINNNNGTVSDIRTGLMWAAMDNGADINWQGAKSYCDNYRGGGYSDWRMPTWNELVGLRDDDLAELYGRAKTYKSGCGDPVHLTELIRLTCSWVWASETSGSEAAAFHFTWGFRDFIPQSSSTIFRALPVRSGR